MKVMRFFFLLLLLGSLSLMLLPSMVMAADSANTTPPTPTPPAETITLTPTYPKMEANAGGTFSFEVALTYLGEKPRVFDLRTTPPQGWEVYITPQYQTDKKISSITLQPSFSGTGDKVLVTANAPAWPIPNPGQYQITLDAVSSGPKGSTALTAVLVNKFLLRTISANDRYNTFATTGKDNVFSIKVVNLSTAAVDNINFSATTKPEGWTIEFKPDKIDSLNALDEKSVDINIKPPAKTIAGDYVFGIRASGKQATADEMTVRVTVESPTIWGWVGVGIILVVVAGLIVIFMRFSRR